MSPRIPLRLSSDAAPTGSVPASWWKAACGWLSASRGFSIAVLFGGLAACSDISAPEPLAEQLSPSTDAYPAADAAIEVKFRGDLQVRLSDGRLQSLRGRSLDGVARVLGRRQSGAAPLVTVPENRLQRLERTLPTRAGGLQIDLRSWYRVPVSTREEAERLSAALRDLPEVEAAYPAPEPAPPPSATPPFVAQQGYFGSAPSGIDLAYARTLPGGRGQGVTIVDMEYDWYFGHEDLGLDASVLLGGERYPYYGDDHGTAVLGQLVGRDNGYGITGGAPDATLKVVSPIFGGGYNPAQAIMVAAATMQPGDVLLIEQQAWGPDNVYVPVEWWLSVYDAISLATGAGIVVVEAAGNGGVNLDGPEFGGRFDRSQYDSGAIIVGAGSAELDWLNFSSYGSRVDLQGWGGWNVVTTGFGGLYGSSKDDYYTGSFSGTSSAAPIVAVAAALVQSHARAVTGQPLPPAEVTDLLRRTGTAQTGDLTRSIGPLPNLRAALGGTSAPYAALNGPYAGAEGQAISFSSAGSTAPDGITYHWTFGDGTSSTLAHPTKTYADDGSYPIALTVTDASGGSATAATTATIVNLAPTAIFSAPASIYEGSRYKLSLAGTDAGIADQATLKYAFDCGLGAGFTSWSNTVKSFTCPLQPDQREPISVRGRVGDKDGAITEYTGAVAVKNALPTLTFRATTATTFGVAESLGVAFTFGDRGVNDAPWTWTITWGDGASSSGTLHERGTTTAVTHLYSRTGTFSPRIRVTDKDGGARAAKVTVTVVP